MTKPFFHADHVGSLLRPARLLAARDRFEKGGLARERLTEIEDECIREVVGHQEGVGLESVSDGEFRRSVWWFEFVDAIEGIEITDPDPGLAFRGDDDSNAWSYAPKNVLTVGKLSRPGNIMERDYVKLAEATSRTAKITIPSPTRIHFHGGRAAVDRGAYPDMDGFWADIARIYQEEIAALEAAGCRYIQLDDPVLTYFLDDRTRGSLRRIGEDPDALLPKYVEVLNRCIAKRGPDTYVSMHLCRGNSRSKWIVEGAYDRLAEIVFPHIGVDALFLEYDDERSGGFEPLRFVPPGQRVVLGLVTTKSGALEDADELKRRIDEAAKYVPMEHLGLSPQCGFASVVEGNIVTFEDEIAKLRLVVDTATDMWGSQRGV